MTGAAPEPPDRDAILAAVMPALLTAQLEVPGEEPRDETGHDVIVAGSACVVAGLPVAREAFGRLGARLRPLVDDGTAVEPGTAVAELGGPVAAIRRAAPVALGFLGRLSAVATGTREADPGEELERWAAALAAGRLSPPGAVDDDGPTFRLGSEG